MGKELPTLHGGLDRSLEVLLRLARLVEAETRVSNVLIEVSAHDSDRRLFCVCIRGEWRGELLANRRYFDHSSLGLSEVLAIFVEETIKGFQEAKAAGEKIREEVAKRKQVKDTYTEGKYRTTVPS